MYIFLPVFMSLENVQWTNKQSKGVRRQISYLIQIIKTGQRYRNLESEVRRSSATQPRLARVFSICRVSFGKWHCNPMSEYVLCQQDSHIRLCKIYKTKTCISVQLERIFTKVVFIYEIPINISKKLIILRINFVIS